MNEPQRETGLAGSTAFWIGDLLVEDEKRFGCLVREYARFTGRMNMDIPLIILEWCAKNNDIASPLNLWLPYSVFSPDARLDTGAH